jgi:glutaredoxin 2
MIVMIEGKKHVLIIERDDASFMADAAAPVQAVAETDSHQLHYLETKALAHRGREIGRDTARYRDTHLPREGGATVPQSPHPLTRDGS